MTATNKCGHVTFLLRSRVSSAKYTGDKNQAKTPQVIEAARNVGVGHTRDIPRFCQLRPGALPNSVYHLKIWTRFILTSWAASQPSLDDYWYVFTRVKSSRLPLDAEAQVTRALSCTMRPHETPPSETPTVSSSSSSNGSEKRLSLKVRHCCCSCLGRGVVMMTSISSETNFRRDERGQGRG